MNKKKIEIDIDPSQNNEEKKDIPGETKLQKAKRLAKARMNAKKTGENEVEKDSEVKRKQDYFPLKKGDNNQYVRQLKRYLNTVLVLPFIKLDDKSLFDEKTESALKYELRVNEVSIQVFSKYLMGQY